MPTISARRNVPVRGQPITCPVSASTSSMDSPCSSISAATVNVTPTPMRLAMKLGVSFANTTCLPSSLSANAAKEATTARVRLGRGNDLQQPHVARRVEEMRSEKALRHPVRRRSQGSGDLLDRQPGGIGGQHRARSQVRHHALQQRALDFEILGDRFNHPVALRQFGQVVFKVARREERGQSRLVKRCRLRFAQRVNRRHGQFVSRLRAVLGHHVEQQRRNSGIGQVSGDARAHRARAKHRGAADQKWLRRSFLG